MNYDSTAGLEHLESSDADKSVATPISMYQDSYRYARSQGMTHTESTQYAIDYHRKYTSREITQHWTETGGNYAEEDVTPFEDIISYNQLVTRLYAILDLQQRRYLFAMVRLKGLEQYLDESNLRLCQEICGTFYPELVRDIAEWIGVKVRENGSCTPIIKYQKRLQEMTLQIIGSKRMIFSY